ncbi:peroxisomal membrane anchor protein conserved region-domain-containing protein [Clohesyomyces aquaticus]|uniref:Peroxisomal membrane protein PEX14 n=1 Tax=Clohesyomyces aquaticus TaxID=1231657 RepID=A0A1Y1ZMZ2_9PLEO|nr:peroxisomal membrane anchor protein conserved region-domain-containing protein [Clohesyomyces aquaticus]
MSGKTAKPAIPDWQRAKPAAQQSPLSEQAESSPKAQPEQSPTRGAEEAAKNEPQEESTSLLEQASRFLEDPTIRDAPRDKKVTFLQSKGVAPGDTEQLLGASTEGESPLDLSKEGDRAWGKTSSEPPSQPPAPTAQQQPQAREIPPIVTYPEFLTQSAKPPPLMTTQRLVSTAYITGGLMATMYGLSQYIIAPMIQTLATSRHEFAAHAQDQLKQLNTRLEDVVSVDPATNPKVKAADPADDISEADSDPTELYHRDFGTQTSPSLSRRPSISASETDTSAVTAHEKRLKILTSHLRELEATRSNDSASSDSLRTKLSDLSTYLAEMSYQSQYYSGMGGMYGANYGMPKTKDGKDDQVEAFKADIRAVKGVFLSSRNFPAGRRIGV